MKRTRDLEEEKVTTEQQSKRLVELDRAKDHFFANISHEFRTPLTLLLGPIEDALAGSEESDIAMPRRRFRMMQRGGQRLLKLINELLDLSKLEVGRLRLRAQQRDLVLFTRALALSFSSLAERKNITLQVATETDELLVYFDADKLEKDCQQPSFEMRSSLRRRGARFS